MTRVLIADDHQLVRQALRRAVEEAGMAVVSEAADGEAAVRHARTTGPDVVLMDVAMPVLDGVEATRRIRAGDPAIRILVLTMHDEEELRARALEAGASGFLTKDCTMREVIEALEAVASGAVLPGAESARRMLAGTMLAASGASGAASTPLSAREREILQFVADGCSTSEIARDLQISVKTVKNHLASIYAKLDARDRTQAVLTGVREGIVQLG